MKNLLAQSPTPEFVVESPLRPEITDVSSLIDIVVSFLFPIAAVLLFVMLLSAGFTYMTSSGEPDKVAKAEKVIVSSIFGFFLLIIAFFLVRILSEVFGLTGGII